MADESFQERPPSGNVRGHNDGEELDSDDSSQQCLALGQSRAPMLVIVLLLSLASCVAAVYFVYQLYRFFATGGAVVPTTVEWQYVLGHLLRAVSFATLAGGLARLRRRIDAHTGEPSDDFAARHRSFWWTSACVLSLLAGYSVYEFAIVVPRDLQLVLRPQFESGYVSINPDRIQIRRGSEIPVEGWLKRQRHGAESFLFVAPAPDIVGNDIQRAVVRIAQFGPLPQGVEFHVQFTADGAKKMERLTTEHVTKPVALFIDDELRNSPRVFATITNSGQFSNVFSMEEAARMIRQNANP